MACCFTEASIPSIAVSDQSNGFPHQFVRLCERALIKFLRESAINYCNFAYSALASFRMGMSGSASFQSVRKS